LDSLPPGVLGFSCTSNGRTRNSTNGCPNRATDQTARERTRDRPGHKGFLRDGKARRGQR
jgi:hypothetical protein